MNTTDAIVKRYNCKAFQSDASVPEADLKQILAMTQRAPTCFNTQPYVAVVARRGTVTCEMLVQAAFATNQDRIRDASATVIFCADLEPTRNLDRLGDLSAAQGYDKELAIARISMPLKLLGWHVQPLRMIISAVKAVAFPIVGLFTPVMTAMLGESTRTWAIKQTMMPVSTFLLAATALGYATSPMEGFDSNRAREAVGLPRRYLPTVIVSLGLPQGEPKSKTLRFDPRDVFFDGNYARPFQNIQPVVESAKKQS